MTYTEQLQDIADDYFAEHGGQATAKEIARWAILNGRWTAPPDSIVQKCAEDIARAMREDYRTDPQGRKVRSKHAVRIVRADGTQGVLWGDLETFPIEYVQRAFQQRREQILADCRQLKDDVDSYNENIVPTLPIQIVFDFTLDLEELAAV